MLCRTPLGGGYPAGTILSVAAGIEKSTLGGLLIPRRWECAARGDQSSAATYLAFIDVAKAYDTVDHTFLFKQLWEMGVRGTTWRLLRSWYSEGTCHVRVDGLATESFPVRQGVRQGAVLSPWLYAAFINPLLRKLRESGLGSYEGDVWCGTLAYADDICLIADSRAELEQMIRICEEHAREYRFKFKASKSEVMVVVPPHSPDYPKNGAACEPWLWTDRAAACPPTPTWLAQARPPDMRRIAAVARAIGTLVRLKTHATERTVPISAIVAAMPGVMDETRAEAAARPDKGVPVRILARNWAGAPGPRAEATVSSVLGTMASAGMVVRRESLNADNKPVERWAVVPPWHLRTREHAAAFAASTVRSVMRTLLLQAAENVAALRGARLCPRNQRDAAVNSYLAIAARNDTGYAEWARLHLDVHALLDMVEISDPICISGGGMRMVGSFRYLGLNVSRDGGWDEMARRMVDASHLRSNRYALHGMRLGEYAPDTAWFLYNATCIPLHNNGVQVWGATKAQCATLDKEMIRVGALVLGLGFKEANNIGAEFVLGELKQMTTASRQDHLCLRYMGHLARMSDKRAVKRMFLLRKADMDNALAAGDATARRLADSSNSQSREASLSWCARARAVLNRYFRSDLWHDLAGIGKLHKKEWDDMTDAVVKRTEGNRWRARVAHNKVLTPIYTSIKGAPGIDPYLVVPGGDATAVAGIARLRGALLGDVMFGRRAKPQVPRAERLCSLCFADDAVSARARGQHTAAVRSYAEKRSNARRPRGGRPATAVVIDLGAGAPMLLPAGFCTSLALPAPQRIADMMPGAFEAGGDIGDSLHILGTCESLAPHRARLWGAVCVALAAYPNADPHGTIVAQLGDARNGDVRLALLLGARPSVRWWTDTAETAARRALCSGALDMVVQWRARTAALPAVDTDGHVIPPPPAAAAHAEESALRSPTPPVPPLVALHRAASLRDDAGASGDTGLDTSGDGDEFDVASILDATDDEYLVHWDGYDEATWEPRSALEDTAQIVVARYWAGRASAGLSPADPTPRC